MPESADLLTVASLSEITVWQFDMIEQKVKMWGPQQHLFPDHAAGDIEGWVDSIHPDEREMIRQNWRVSVVNRVPFCVSYRLRQDDGSYRWVEDRGTPILDDDGSVHKWVGTVTDIEDRLAVERQLQITQERLRIAAESVQIGLWEIDLETGRRWISERAARILGHGAAGWIDRETSYAIIHPDDADRVASAVSAHVASRSLEDLTLEFRLRRREEAGHPWVSAVGKIVYDAAGEPVSIIGSTRDISDGRREHETLVKLAYEDDLTKLPNRRGLFEHLSECLLGDDCVSLAMIDIDGFKDAEDCVGNDAADELLKSLAQRLQQIAPAGAFVARFGGDEFAIVVTGDRPQDLLRRATRKVHASLDRPFDVGGRSVFLSVTIGMASARPATISTEDLASRALMALSEAKTAKRGSTRAFSPAMLQNRLKARRLNEELPRAVLAHEFELHYQPQVRLADEEVIGMEALIRWRHPERGLLAPVHFIDALARSRWAVEVGNWVLDEACRATANLRREGIELRVGVNLFPAQFHSSNFLAIVQAALARHALPASCLEIEITETIVLANDERVLATLRKLRDLGCGIAFDDYGTGYASLSMLKRYPITCLKIDRSFVSNVCASDGDLAIVDAVLGLGRNFDIGVIAEGIETQEQARKLEALGCREAQGYLFGRPMPLADLRAACRPGLPGSLVAHRAAGQAVWMEHERTAR